MKELETMTGRSMIGRVEALEHSEGLGGHLLLVREPGETECDALARYERSHGPFGSNRFVTWIVTGVPRGEGSPSCA